MKFSLHNEKKETVARGNQYEMNNYMMYNGIDYTVEYVEKVNNNDCVVHFTNGCFLLIEE